MNKFLIGLAALVAVVCLMAPKASAAELDLSLQYPDLPRLRVILGWIRSNLPEIQLPRYRLPGLPSLDLPDMGLRDLRRSLQGLTPRVPNLRRMLGLPSMRMREDAIVNDMNNRMNLMREALQ